MEEMNSDAVMITLPTNEAKVDAQPPKAGCRQVRILNVVSCLNQYGEERVHVDFSYKGFSWGNVFKLTSPTLKALFGDAIKVSDIGTLKFAEVVEKYGNKGYYPSVEGAEEVESV